MINEREEFLAYTEQPIYSAQNKRDTAYMGRFTFDMLLDFEGLSRVLTIVARGYMWQGEEPDIERAARALLSNAPPVRFGHGAACRTAKKPAQERTGNIEANMQIHTGNSPNWWTNKARAGSAAMFTEFAIS